MATGMFYVLSLYCYGKIIIVLDLEFIVYYDEIYALDLHKHLNAIPTHLVYIPNYDD